MSLSCDCGWDDYEWLYEVEEEERSAATPFRCYGCSDRKPTLEPVRRIWSHEIDEDGCEANYKIIGRLCEACSGQYDSLIELGFCLVADNGFIGEAMREYRENYVIQPKQEQER